MLKIEKCAGVIKSFSAKDKPSPAPSKAGTKPTMLHHVKCVIAIDVTECPDVVEDLFPAAKIAIERTAGDDTNKGWTQTSKTKPGSMTLKVKGSDGEAFDLDCAHVNSGAQLKVSAQNGKKTNQAALVLRCIGRFTADQVMALHGLLGSDVKVWMNAAQTSFFDEKPKKGKKSDAEAAAEVADIEAKINKPRLVGQTA